MRGKLGKKILAVMLSVSMILENFVITDATENQSVKHITERLSLGQDHCGAITEDGDLYMWGRNAYGEIGNGSTQDQLTPQKVLSDVVSVSLGNSHSGAITEDGSLCMWGYNYDGQIGNGSTKHQLTPVKVMSIGNSVKVHVTAIDKTTNESVPVEDAEVYLYIGQKLMSITFTDSDGNAKVSLDGFTRKELRKATISAKKIVSRGKALNAEDGDARADLFEHFPKDENGDYYRYTMELHSHSLKEDGTVDVKTIDDNGNWVGAAIPERDRYTLSREMNLELSEPRMLVNLAVCYFADDSISKSEKYEQYVMTMLNAYAHRLAEATDAHIMIDKILLFSTDDRFDFYFRDGETPNIASMADIQIQAEVSYTGFNGNNVIIHNNAFAFGFFSDEISNVNEKYLGVFFNLQDADSYLGRHTFSKILSGGVDINGKSMKDDVYDFSAMQAHETGHYLMGFRDEYQRGSDDGTEWIELGYRPYSPNFGLMEDEYSDIEISRNSVEYAYMNNDYEHMTKSLHTEHSRWRKGSCEDMLADWMTNEEYIDEYAHLIDAPNVDFSVGKYKSTYSKVEGSADHRASYSYAELDDRDFLSVPLHETSSLSFNENATDETKEILADSDAVLTKDPIAEVSFTSSDNGVVVSLDEKSGTAYTLSYGKSGEDSFSAVKLSNGTATLSIGKGDLAEVRIGADGLYNCYYIDRSENTDVGYIYTSADNAVMAYVTKDTEDSYTFIADNTGYTNDEYISMNQATWISGDSGNEFDSGEIYSVASYYGSN